MYRRIAIVCLALAAGALTFAAPARAELAITIDKSIQQMTVALDGAPLFVWPVSTGAAGYDTPSGTFTPFRMEKDHFSREWDDAPMPFSVFFTKRGHAIHGSNHNSIGRPASHGCVRLTPQNAKILFDLVKQEGLAKTRIVLHGHTPGVARPPQVARQRNDYQPEYTDDDRDIVGTIPPPQQRRMTRSWREYNEGPRYYYYRERPYYPPVRRYGYGTPEPYPFYAR